MSAGNHDSLVQRQFGASAENYRTSDTHARGRSLARLVELALPRPDWIVLDVATGAGHMAAALAPRVEAVVAGDMTCEMLEQAGMVGRELGLDNIHFVQESAQALSYREQVFDLVVCRVAAHHFPDPGAFVAESTRVLKPDGVLAVIDNIAPEDQAAAQWTDEFERRRDPSHVRCLSIAQWHELYTAHGYEIVHSEASSKRFDFHEWMGRMNVPGVQIDRLAHELFGAPDAVKSFWQPRQDGGHIELALQEAILIGRLKS